MKDRFATSKLRGLKKAIVTLAFLQVVSFAHAFTLIGLIAASTKQGEPVVFIPDSIYFNISNANVVVNITVPLIGSEYSAIVNLNDPTYFKYLGDVVFNPGDTVGSRIHAYRFVFTGYTITSEVALIDLALQYQGQYIQDFSGFKKGCIQQGIPPSRVAMLARYYLLPNSVFNASDYPYSDYNTDYGSLSVYDQQVIATILNWELGNDKPGVNDYVNMLDPTQNDESWVPRAFYNTSTKSSNGTCGCQQDAIGLINDVNNSLISIGPNDDYDFENFMDDLSIQSAILCYCSGSYYFLAYSTTDGNTSDYSYEFIGIPLQANMPFINSKVVFDNNNVYTAEAYSYNCQSTFGITYTGSGNFQYSNGFLPFYPPYSSTNLYWTGSQDSLWTNSQNWSHQSGGTGGAGIPDSTKSLIFDQGSIRNCYLTTTGAAKSISLGCNFSNTLFLNGHNGTLTCTGNVTVLGGAFYARDSILTIDSSLVIDNSEFYDSTTITNIAGNFAVTDWGEFDGWGNIYLKGNVNFDASTAQPTLATILLGVPSPGIFNSTSGNLYMYNNFIDSLEVFNANGGSVILMKNLAVNASTDFYNLTVMDSVQVTLTNEVYVDNTLEVDHGASILLNGYGIQALGSFPNMDSTAQLIVTDNPAFSNQLSWYQGTNTGAYHIPFFTQSGQDVSMDYNVEIAGGDPSGILLFSTYATNANNSPQNNLPHPSTNSMQSYFDTSRDFNSLETVDRFWAMDALRYNSGAPPVGKLTMRYTTADIGGLNILHEADLVTNDYYQAGFDTLKGIVDTVHHSFVLDSLSTAYNIIMLQDSGASPPVIDSSILYWVGIQDNNWTNAQNWSFLSGGPGGAGIPDSTKNIIFDSQGSTYCMLGGGWPVITGYAKSVLMDSTDTNPFYLAGRLQFHKIIISGGGFHIQTDSFFIQPNDTILINNGSVICDNNPFIGIYGVLTMNGGGFGGENSLSYYYYNYDNSGTGDLMISGDYNSTILVTGKLDFNGGIFTSTQGILYTSDNFMDPAGVFKNNSGTVIFTKNPQTSQVNINAVNDFYNLILQDSMQVTLYTDLVADDSLTLGNATQLVMSGYGIQDLGSFPVFQPSTQLIVTDNPAFSNSFSWYLGFGTGTFHIPFFNQSAQDVSVDYQIEETGGDMEGMMLVSTYATNPDYTPTNNVPYPTPMLTYFDSAYDFVANYVVDRYWALDALRYNAGPPPVGMFTMRFTATDIGGTNTIDDARLVANDYYNTGFDTLRGSVDTVNHIFILDSLSTAYNIIMLEDSAAIPPVIDSSDVYWVGGEDSLWNNPHNWSFVPGGPGTAGVPDSTKSIIFDGYGNIDAILGSNVTVNSLQINSGYTARIVKATYTLTILQNTTLAAGDVLNGSGNLTLNNNVNLNGGTINLAGGSVTINGALNLTNGSVTGNGTLTVSGGIQMAGGIIDATASNLTIAADLTSTGGTINTGGGILALTGTTNLNGATINTSTGTLQMNVLNLLSGTVNANTGTLSLTSNLNQTGGVFNGNSAAITVSGNVLLSAGSFMSTSNTLNIYGNFTENTDVFRHNNGTLVLYGNGTTITAFNNSATNENLDKTKGFYNLNIGDSYNKNLGGWAIVQNNLNLGTGILTLNAYVLLINNPLATAVTSSTGGIVAEDNTCSAALQWNIYSNTGNYTIPFQTAAGAGIPIMFAVSTAGQVFNPGYSQSIVLSTYPTGTDKTPYATGVYNFLNASGSQNLNNVLDRFWLISAKNYLVNPTSNITLQYTSNDLIGFATSESNIIAQRWNGEGWDQPQGAVNTSNRTIQVPGLTHFGTWVLSSNLQPLITPVTVSFAEPQLELDGSYYNTLDGDLFFRYRERYQNGTLNYSIYDKTRTAVLSDNTATNKYYGENWYMFPSQLFTNLVNGNYYTLEITDTKGDVWKLRFQYNAPTGMPVWQGMPPAYSSSTQSGVITVNR